MINKSHLLSKGKSNLLNIYNYLDVIELDVDATSKLSSTNSLLINRIISFIKLMLVSFNVLLYITFNSIQFTILSLTLVLNLRDNTYHFLHFQLLLSQLLIIITYNNFRSHKMNTKQASPLLFGALFIFVSIVYTLKYN